MAGWRSRFAWDSISSGSGSRSGRSGVTLRICFALLNTKSGRRSLILSRTIIKINGATIEHVFLNVCVKAFDTCAVHESPHPTQAFRLKHSMRCGAARLHFTVPMAT